MGAYGDDSSRLRNFWGFKLVTKLKETKEAKCKRSVSIFYIEIVGVIIRQGNAVESLCSKCSTAGNYSNQNA